MPLPAPELDNRTSQSIVDEAKRMIPQFCPEWTDHNVSDPGVTLIELFAWMTEMLLYRVNQVPAKNYVKFLEMLGLKLRPPQAAEVNITFYLSAPLHELQEKPEVWTGTEIATIRTEIKPAVVFVTVEDLNLRTPKLAGAFTDSVRVIEGENGKPAYFVEPIKHDLERLRQPEETITMFSNPPMHAESDHEGDRFHLVFEHNPGRHVISLLFEFKEFASLGGVVGGVTANNPPRVWQAWSGEEFKWVNCGIENDSTRGFTQNGEIVLRLPAIDQMTMEGVTGFWLRCHLTEPMDGQSPYDNSPALQNEIQVAALGGTIRARHAIIVKNEVLGVSDGTPGQCFQFPHKPLLERNKEYDRLSLNNGTSDEKGAVWQEVSDFGDSGKDSFHYTIDDLAGTLSFGPALRQPDGNIRRFGKVPPRGAQLSFTQYSYGGGTIGNVAAQTVTMQKSAKPYITKVTNWEPSTGGRDAESLEEAILRVPAALRSHQRAVTAEDYEYHAKNVAGVADAYCVGPGLIIPSESDKTDAPRPGEVYVYLLPQVGATESPRVDQIKLNESVRQAVLAQLQERSVLGVTVKVMPVKIVGVSIDAKLVGKDKTRDEDLKQQVKVALDRFLNPYTGGPQGKGWRQVSVLHKSDIYRLLLNLPMVERIEHILMFDAAKKPITVSLELGQVVVCSGQHVINIVPGV